MKRHPRINLVLFLATLVFSFPAQAGVTNILDNASFEQAIGTNWDNTANRGISIVTTTASPDGNRLLRLDEATTVAGGFTGVFTFQTRAGAKPGDHVSFSGLVRANTLEAGDEGQIRIEFQRTSGTIISALNASVTATSAGFNRLSVSGIAPNGTEQAVFVLRIQPAGAGETSQVDYDAMEATVTSQPIILQPASGGSSRILHPGQLSVIALKVLNVSADTINNVELVVEASAGIDILNSRGSLNGRRVAEREGSLIYSLGNLHRAQDAIFDFPILVNLGAKTGKRYEVIIRARANGQTLSDEVHVVILVEPDPLFDEGTVLGKVFDDRNGDGEQNPGELGAPGVRLYTEYGVSVVTDINGQFHIPAVRPGRHIVKIDGHTLPPKTEFLSEESLLIKTTPGILNKIRFAVRLPESALPEDFRKSLHMWVTQGVDKTRPILRVSLEPDVLRTGLGRLEREPFFKIYSNYREYIFGWRLEITNEMGEKIWTGVGISQPPSFVTWNGMTDTGEMIRPGVYAYRLIVRDQQDREDWTSLKFFRVMSKLTPQEDHPIEIPSTGNFNIMRDGKQSIPLVAKPTLRVYGKTEPGRLVLLNGNPIDISPEGEFEQEFYTVPGEKTISVSAINYLGDTLTQEQKITVKNSSFFLVALGEEELGENIFKGNQETVGRDDAFQEDFYNEGRLAYYLKAKIRGKFLVKSRYDSSDERSQFFTQLDPDEYYPIYGDYSQISYEGQETKDKLFLLVEMERSHLQWGSYKTAFTDTELGRYNRTLSGLKLHHETLSATKYGDPKRVINLFYSKSDTRADHIEFRATGGSLYYLRNRNIIAGSEKLRVETRDKIQDITLESRDLINGQDYEIDYKQGRILLRQPLSSVAASQTIIANDILDGNPVFLVVDYEFYSFDIFKENPAGIRAYTHMGDHIRIGGTAVEEKRANYDYDMRAVDAVIKAGPNTKITMEFAQAKQQQGLQGLSYDGGLSFQNQSLLTGRRPREKAYLVKGETKPLEKMDVSGYIQNVEPGFSVDRIKSQEGYRKYGLHAKYKFSDHFYILGRQDLTEVAAQLRPLGINNVSVPFEKLASTTGQAVFDYAGWKFTGEYLHQSLDIPLSNRVNSIYSEKPFENGVGLKLARRVSDWLTPYIRGQYTFTGKTNLQAGPGVEAKIGDRTHVYFEEMIGTVGDSTLLGISTQQDVKTTSYATIKVRDTDLSENQVSTSIGTSHRLTEKSRIYSEREHSVHTGNISRSLVPTFAGDTADPGVWSSDIYGYDTRLTERWDVGVKFERRRLDANDFRNLSDVALNNEAQSNSYNAASGSWSYNNPKKFRFTQTMEVRFSQSAPDINQWVTQNRVEWKINQDLSFLGRLNFGNSRLLEPGDLAGRFTEFNAGLAYRPVRSNRLNWLARYTFLDEIANDAQFVRTHSGSLAWDERAHIFAVEAGYELTRHVQLVEKLAYRVGSIETPDGYRYGVDTLLWINRFNYRIIKKWDLALEYRMLFQLDSVYALRHGPLVEIDREIYDYIRFGIGYNFTDFDDDLRKVNEFHKNGFFVRLTGKV